MSYALPQIWSQTLFLVECYKPTIVKVVKNETATTILIPASTREPTNGNATNAGIRVLPTNAETMVDISVFDLAAISLIVSGGKNVNMSPIKNRIL